jgi:hypothetical protein
MRHVLAALLLISVPAYGAPPPDADPSFARWFRSLQAGDGGPCCSIADCRSVAARLTGDHYEVLIGAAHGVSPPQWVVVPPNKVLQHTDNPVGRPVACWTRARGVVCFVRAPES